MKQEIKIFNATNLKDALKNCIKEGFTPQNLKQVGKLIRDNKIEKQWYDVASVWDRNIFEIRNFTNKELKNLNKIFNLTSLSRLYLNGYLNLSSNYDGLAGSSSDGRVVGVKKK